MKLSSAILLVGAASANPLLADRIPEPEFLGTFEGFEFDAKLAELNNPFAADLLSIKDDDVDLSVEEMEVIQLEQRGWFDDAVTREESRKKKLKQVLKMVYYLQADNSAEALEKYLYYGCYCFPDGSTRLFSGYGEPIDEVDRVCKAFQTCYRCVGIDYGQEECINTRGYAFQGNENKETGQKQLICKDNGKGEASQCSRAQCECDKQLAIELAEMEIAWNPMNQGSKYGMFERQTQCAAQERAAIETDTIEPKCCGYYPKRTPYAYNGPNGIRNCCGSKTYDPNMLECCPGDVLQSLGTCIY